MDISIGISLDIGIGMDIDMGTDIGSIIIYQIHVDTVFGRLIMYLSQ
jgi:hypothetical protein